MNRIFKNITWSIRKKRSSRIIATDSSTRMVASALTKFIVLSIFIVIVVFPFYWMMLSALKTTGQWNTVDNITGIQTGPSDLTANPTFWENFSEVFKNPDFLGALWTTILVTFASVFTKIFITTLAGFGFAHYNFRFKKTLFIILMMTMMLPEEALLFGQYQMIVKTNLLGTIPALFIPFMASVFTIYLTRTSFERIPESIKKSAKMDGISTLKYFFKIALPYITPTLITNIILSSIASWNAFLWASIVAPADHSIDTLPILLMRFKMDTDINRISPTLIFAVSAVVTAPLIVTFLVFRKRILNGIGRRSGGTKGS